MMSPIEEEEEENFVLQALFKASEEGNISGLLELLEGAENLEINMTNKHGETMLHMAASGGQVEVINTLIEKGIDLNITDKHGDSAVYWAARQGQVEVIKLLKEKGVSLNTQNKAGEAAIHIAARYGHVKVIEYLCAAGADVNLLDKLGESVLHIGAWHGLQPRLLALLCKAGAKVDQKNKKEETPLRCAASRGNLDCVKVLLSYQAPINAPDKRGSTPLHLACRRRHIPIAMLLIHTNALMDLCDQTKETPLHPACREGLLPVVQTMCAFGCAVDIINKGGMSALHIAARAGHIEIVRCLLLSGIEPDIPNKDGISSEIMSLAQGHNDIAELLCKLKHERRDMCIKQLLPSNHHLKRIKMKVFGNSGVGKTTLINSLKCGFFKALLKWKPKQVTHSNSETNGTVTKPQENGTKLNRTASMSPQVSYDVSNDEYTHGVDVQQCDISGIGELSVWEFSGYEPYFFLYDHFIGDPNCIHLIVFNLEDPPEVQLEQINFWLNFLKARMAPMEPVGEGGRQPWPARITLVATHGDKANPPKNDIGEYYNIDTTNMLGQVKQRFRSDFLIVDQVFIMDAHIANSPEIKALRAVLGEVKSHVVKNLPYSNGFLEAVVAALPNWRKIMSSFPVVTWPSFIEYIRAKVNLLASEEHLKEVMCQLQLVGEVIYVETQNEKDMVVLDPKWLCIDIIGQLLSRERLLNSRPTGCYMPDEFQFMFPGTEAPELLPLLEALEIGIQCDIDGDIEYEFPCLNFVETINGLWEKDDHRIRNPVYAGVRIVGAKQMVKQLAHMFPRLQIMLRRDVSSNNNAPESDLYQWFHGSKYCNGFMESMITVHEEGGAIEIKVRGPSESKSELFTFMEDLCEVVDNLLDDTCPGLLVEKQYLSPAHLKKHVKSPRCYTQREVFACQLQPENTLKLDSDTTEDLIDVVCCSSDTVRATLALGADLHVSHLSVQTRRQLAELLDVDDEKGLNWCMLAISLGMTDDIPKLDVQNTPYPFSKTDRTLEMWSKDKECTVKTLLEKLRALGRDDAADVVVNSAPLYQVCPPAEGAPDDPSTSAQAVLNNSENTLASSVSR